MASKFLLRATQIVNSSLRRSAILTQRPNVNTKWSQSSSCIFTTRKSFNIINVDFDVFLTSRDINWPNASFNNVNIWNSGWLNAEKCKLQPLYPWNLVCLPPINHIHRCDVIQIKVHQSENSPMSYVLNVVNLTTYNGLIKNWRDSEEIYCIQYDGWKGKKACGVLCFRCDGM